MTKTLKFLAAAAILAAAVSCASTEKMVKMAENVIVTCDPAVLEAVGGNIDATVKVTYPADYFNPKAIVEVTPVLVYDGGEAKMAPFVYQGEKVKDNYKTVSAAGQTVTENIHFDFVEGMEKAYLELRGVVKGNNKELALPSRKVADGVNTTYMLVKSDGVVPFKADGYANTFTDKAEGQILYTVNSSEVRGKELKGSSIKNFQDAVNKLNANDKAKITGTEIVAYASPEGAETLNNKLSDKRSETAAKAWNKVMKGYDVAAPEVKSVGEDWEGFQKLVNESNIEDKELILRVLSMYSDPAVRENEIRNMSQVFTALKGEVLPELRRARLIANVEVKNYTNEELVDILKNNEKILDEEALLRVASVAKDAAQKESIYQKAIERFNSQRAMYNLAVLYLSEGKMAKAKAGLGELDAKDADVINAKGVVALREDDLQTAEACFRQAGTPEAKKNLGIVQILTGEYDAAVQTLKDVDGCCHNTVLAYILTDQLDKAKASAHCGDPKVWYLKAIISARQGKADEVSKNLERAFRNPALKERASRDIEFAGYSF